MITQVHLARPAYGRLPHAEGGGVRGGDSIHGRPKQGKERAGRRLAAQRGMVREYVNRFMLYV